MLPTHRALPDSATPASDEQRIATLLRRLGWAGPLAMFVTALAVGMSFYFLQVRPLAQDDIEMR